MMRGNWICKFLTIVTAVLMSIALIACNDADRSAGGGIGGTGNGGVGLGEITGFGSVKLDDDSTFQTDDSTEFFIDGAKFDSEAAFKAALGGSDDPVGAVAVVQARADVSDDFTSGTAARVEVHSSLKGPVTGVDPLQVLEQTVVLTGDTVRADLPSGGLQVGDEVEVHGFRDSGAGAILATRVQYKAGGNEEWKLTGFVTASGNTTFNVGAQTVSLAVVSASDCGAQVPPVDRFVEVKARPSDHTGFGSGATLTASAAECKRHGLIGELDDTSGVTLRRIQGFVSAVAVDGNSFTVGGTGSEGQVVQWSGSTTFRGGAPEEDLVVGAKVEVTGRFDAASDVLTAARISFRETRVRIEATLNPSDVDANAQTLTLFGITVQGTAMTRDEDNFLGGGQPARDVRVRGFVDGDGTVFATRIDDRGDPGDDDLRLRGPVDEGFSNPTFSILGVSIDPDGGTVYRDHRGGSSVSIGQNEFFGELTAGMPVQVSKGNFTAPPPTISGNLEIDLED